ncbi:MAG: transposase [Acidobacteria bacterium]|nr:transposase [Acidobacteriota bacterium]
MTSHPLPYYDVMRESKDSRFLRLRLVRFAQEHGIRSAAQAFSTRRKTVRKWLRRYEEDGYAALLDRSRAPKNPARPIPPSQRRRALELKRKLPSWGAQRIKDQFKLSISEKAIRKIWRAEGLLKRKRRKHKTKQNLREIKRRWKLFEQTDVDTKDLDDIPELWPQIQRNGLPLIQYTAREVTSGLQFLAYADERCLAYSTLFVELIIEHLEHCGIDIADCHFQTDNGSEFIGSWNAKNDSSFTNAIQKAGAVHRTIPPGAHTFQADVETVHRIIEDEFYEVERFDTLGDFLHKAYTYNLWFNCARKNSYKENQSPWDIVRKRNPDLPIAIIDFPVLLLDSLFALRISNKGGYDVLPHPFVPAVQLASCSQINRVMLSVIVPLPLSVNRGVGGVTPA